MQDIESLKEIASELIEKHSMAVLVHANHHQAHDALLMRKPVEKDAAIRRLMAANQQAYTAAEKAVEGEAEYAGFLAELRSADYARMNALGEVQNLGLRCDLAISLVAVAVAS